MTKEDEWERFLGLVREIWFLVKTCLLNLLKGGERHPSILIKAGCHLCDQIWKRFIFDNTLFHPSMTLLYPIHLTRCSDVICKRGQRT